MSQSGNIDWRACFARHKNVYVYIPNVIGACNVSIESPCSLPDSCNSNCRCCRLPAHSADCGSSCFRVQLSGDMCRGLLLGVSAEWLRSLQLPCHASSNQHMLSLDTPATVLLLRCHAHVSIFLCHMCSAAALQFRLRRIGRACCSDFQSDLDSWQRTRYGDRQVSADFCL